MSRIKAIERLQIKTEKLYNLAVKENESYIANGVVVHNCRSLLIPITKYEDYKSDPNYNPEVNMESLVKMGGGLLVPAKGGASMFDLKYEVLSVGRIIEAFGDYVLITNPAENRKINIVNIFASNLDNEKPVTVAFKDSKEQGYRYQTMLEYAGGVLEKGFNQEPWQLNIGSDFIVSISANVRTSIEVRYYISDTLMEPAVV